MTKSAYYGGKWYALVLFIGEAITHLFCGPTPKRIYGPFSRAHPGFGPFLGSGATEGQLLLILVRDQQNLNFPNILVVIENFWVPARINGETAVFPRKKFTKIDFLLSDVKNMVPFKIGAYPKSAVTGAFWPKTQFLASAIKF